MTNPIAIYALAIVLDMGTAQGLPANATDGEIARTMTTTTIVLEPTFTSSLKCQQTARELTDRTIGKVISVKREAPYTTIEGEFLGAWCNVIKQNKKG
jgi:hypothetical protein